MFCKDRVDWPWTQIAVNSRLVQSMPTDIRERLLRARRTQITGTGIGYKSSRSSVPMWYDPRKRELVRKDPLVRGEAYIDDGDVPHGIPQGLLPSILYTHETQARCPRDCPMGFICSIYNVTMLLCDVCSRRFIVAPRHVPGYPRSVPREEALFFEIPGDRQRGRGRDQGQSWSCVHNDSWTGKIQCGRCAAWIEGEDKNRDVPKNWALILG
jgi:hypothetical protein